MKWPKLSETQSRILEAIIFGAEIQVTLFDEKYTYDLCYENGDDETINVRTFEKLRDLGLVKLKWRPAENVERWA